MLQKYEKQLKVIHNSSSVSRGNSFEKKSEPPYKTDLKDEPVYYRNKLQEDVLIIIKAAIKIRNKENIAVRAHNIKV